MNTFRIIVEETPDDRRDGWWLLRLGNAETAARVKLPTFMLPADTRREAVVHISHAHKPGAGFWRVEG
ncbi:hypothetical protein LCGC14_1636100 [marine sediment metagenome]|uniref:Uncharacterized protein n=1 Tax=marine sediment metagenome TaxID=412755 RepID=A0A0F9L0L5_9ZZZZ